jgi:hypothetical protein
MAKRDKVTGTPADPLVEYVPLELGGKTYSLVFTFLSLARAEQAVNALRAPGEEKCNLLHGIAVIIFHGMDAREMLGMFYGALLPAWPKATLEDASALLGIDTWSEVHEALLKAYKLSMREAKKDSDPPVGDAAAPATN